MDGARGRYLGGKLILRIKLVVGVEENPFHHKDTVVVDHGGVLEVEMNLLEVAHGVAVQVGVGEALALAFEFQDDEVKVPQSGRGTVIEMVNTDVGGVAAQSRERGDRAGADDEQGE